MDKYSNEEIEEALHIVTSVLRRCEKTQPKFEEGTSQHTLLKNRIKALSISKSLLSDDNFMEKYTKDELIVALGPISSIISKCEKAQLKFSEGTAYHTRFKKMIKAMTISETVLTDEISKRT
ncbi:hypothetical protein LPY66_11575 [Dehalobacter sp. DCM]|uniref:hypothetical protein n=1 Tax=Dehalobacter sp. DCM TaxID=2907827 RepID=UPI003081C7B6|nr:hypothetical protein LPY66_11575 [Dehalobacter sp. DCM]